MMPNGCAGISGIDPAGYVSAMRKFLLVAALALAVIAPTAARADSARLVRGAVLGGIADPGESVTFTKQELLVIGAGALAGAVVLDLLVSTDLSILAGGIAGGMLSDWRYRHGGEAQLAPRLKATLLGATDAAGSGVFSDRARAP